MIDTSLNKALLESVDSGLLILGENSRKAIYFHLEKTFKIKREEIALKFDEFKETLEHIFGPGAEIIEKVIMKELRIKLDLDFELTSHVDLVREIHERQREEKWSKNCLAEE